MSNNEIEIRQELESLAEEKYQKFASRLIPNCNNMIGVRIPNIRRIAKRIAKQNAIQYLENANDIYFEETMLKALIIGNMKENIEVVLHQIELFVPKINNWSICDSFCNELKIVRNYKEDVWTFLEKYYKSNEPYEIRFAVVMFLSHYIEEKYIDELLLIFDSIKNKDYYVKMAVAWGISKCFVKFENKTMAYLKNNNLDDETYNKSLQKICDSLQVNIETKAKIKCMKR